jgi:putative peptidoglycan lipid II flippase
VLRGLSRSSRTHNLIGAPDVRQPIVGIGARDRRRATISAPGTVAKRRSPVAFTIPNLFRKLLGESALSAAFIPLYAQAEKRGTTESGETASDFAAASVNLLALILIGITIVGEAVIVCLRLRVVE